MSMAADALSTVTMEYLILPSPKSILCRLQILYPFFTDRDRLYGQSLFRT